MGQLGTAPRGSQNYFGLGMSTGGVVSKKKAAKERVFRVDYIKDDSNGGGRQRGEGKNEREMKT